MTRVTFLGTGASGGTPGSGRSKRRESSALAVAGDVSVLMDVTNQFHEQSQLVDRLDAVVVTHAHRDATGGVPALDRWLHDHKQAPVPVLTSAEAVGVLRERHGDLDYCDLQPVHPGQRRNVGPWSITAVEVPHARDQRFRTFAWRLERDGTVLVYASDVAELTENLAQATRGADLLALDGAMYGRSLFSHLRIDEALPVVCRWDVDRILLTQIGRTAPAHDELVEVAARLCERAAPAYDGLTVQL
ncbi:MAG: MBL fold metallo-hydrolase [Actinomycetota bacterium]|nr:MBL fold metallo-hydrolase [Actinomycetota bacterium]